jgi:hypothetical protein
MSDSDFDDSFDLTRIPTAPRLLSDTSQLSGVGSSSLVSQSSQSSHVPRNPHPPVHAHSAYADLSLTELSLDPTAGHAGQKGPGARSHPKPKARPKPKFSILPQRAQAEDETVDDEPSYSRQGGAINEEDEFLEEEAEGEELGIYEEGESVIDETIHAPARGPTSQDAEGANVDDETRARNTHRAREEAIQQELSNIRRMNETLRNYHDVLRGTLAEREVTIFSRPGIGTCSDSSSSVLQGRLQTRMHYWTGTLLLCHERMRSPTSSLTSGGGVRMSYVSTVWISRLYLIVVL